MRNGGNQSLYKEARPFLQHCPTFADKLGVALVHGCGQSVAEIEIFFWGGGGEGKTLNEPTKNFASTPEV